MIRLEIDSVPAIVLDAPGEDITLGDEVAVFNGEVPSLSVTLDNARGHLTPLFANPPLLARAVLSEGGIEIFTGRVQRVVLGVAIIIQLEA